MPGFNIGSHGDGPPNTQEASRKHRYLVKVMNPLSTDLLFFARKVTLPIVEIDRIVMHHKQEEIYLPGKHRIQTCDINFYRVHDHGGDKAAREIYNWWSKNVISLENSGLASDDQGTFDKKNAEIHVLDGSGITVYKYLLYGIWPNKISPDALDFSDSSIAEIVATFVVDKLKEEPGSGSGSSASPGAIQEQSTSMCET